MGGAGSTVPVIYEVSLEIDPAAAADYDTWLEGHMRRVLEQEGFEAGRVFKPEPPAAEDGWTRRVVQYHVRSQRDLDRYLDGAAATLRAEGVARFGERFRAARRVLTPSSELATPSASRGAETVTECPNCGSVNIQEFCAHCGQNNRVSVVAFHRLLGDFFGDLFNFDSRLLNSIWPLLVRPGLLTKEFLAGRRARFIPPVRMYLFMSLLFFGMATLWVSTGRLHLGEEAQGDLASEVSDARAGARPRPARLQKDGFGVHLDKDGETAVHFTDAESGFLKDAEERASHNVKKLRDDKEYRQLFVERGVGNLPIMMFLLLPIYALILQILYVRSRRYYVEHLIYSLHLHCFVFLTLGTALGWTLALDLAGYQPAVPGWLTAAFWVWFGLYPWFAMRRVYGQGWFKTSVKYFLLGLIYFVLLVFGVVGAVLFTLST